MKKIITFGTILVVTLFLCCSCGVSQADELIRCLNEHDAEGIKDLFCEKINESTTIDLDEQIKTVFELMGEETIVSYHVKGGSERQSIRNHKLVLLDQCIIIDSAELSNGNMIEEFYFYTYTINDARPDAVGISEITIVFNSTKYYIGNFDLV